MQGRIIKIVKVINLHKQSGYILIFNILIISLLGIFIPVVAQNNYINYQLSKNKNISARGIQAVEGGAEYVLYLLQNNRQVEKEFSLILDDNLKLDCSFSSGNADGKEVYFFSCKTSSKNCCQLSMIINKEDLKIIDKNIARGD
ncbi:MAG: hypothetical protein ACQESS_08380 [Bacillota bacterium]